jgi:hypothetical protein
MSYALKSALPPALSQPENPQKRNMGWLPITLVAFGLLVAIIGSLVIVNVTASTTTKTLDAFCNDLKKSDYHAAYSQFSPDYQHKISEQKFINKLVSTGAVSCTYSSVGEDGDRTSAVINYQNVIGIIEIDDATLVKGNDRVWKIHTLVNEPQNLHSRFAHFPKGFESIGTRDTSFIF